MSRVLQVVVEPQNRTLLKWLGNYYSDYSYIEVFIKDMVVLEAMLECCIDYLSVHDLLGSEGINLILVATIGKHMVKITDLSM